MAVIITIAQQKGGVGKTTTVVNLSHGLAREGYKVLAVDLGVQSQVASYLDIERNPGAYHLVAAGQSPEMIPAVLELYVRESGRENLRVLPSTNLLKKAEVLLNDVSPQYVRDILTKLPSSHNYDYLVIDTSPSIGNIQEQAMTACDYLITPVKAAYASLEGLAALLHNLRGLKDRGWGGYLLGVLPTFYKETTKQSTKAMNFIYELTEGHEELVFDPIHAATIIEECAEYGRTVFEHAARDRAAQEYDAFTRAVIRATKG